MARTGADLKRGNLNLAHMIASCEPFMIHLNLLSRPVMQRPMCSPMTDLPQTDRSKEKDVRPIREDPQETPSHQHRTRWLECRCNSSSGSFLESMHNGTEAGISGTRIVSHGSLHFYPMQDTLECVSFRDAEPWHFWSTPAPAPAKQSGSGSGFGQNVPAPAVPAPMIKSSYEP